MKKILFVCIALIFTASGLHAVSLVPKAGIDIPSTIDYEYGADRETKIGYNAALEIRGGISEYFSLGIGAEYNFPRGLVNADGDTDFSFLPVYASLMFSPLKTWGEGDVKPYFKANIGYSVNAVNNIGEKAEGGLYYGGGVGAEFNNFVMEVIGSRYSGSYENPDIINMDYVKIGISIGYKINFSGKSEPEPESDTETESFPAPSSETEGDLTFEDMKF